MTVTSSGLWSEEQYLEVFYGLIRRVRQPAAQAREGYSCYVMNRRFKVNFTSRNEIHIFSCPLFAEDTINAVVIQNLMKFLPTVIDFKYLLSNQNVQFPGTKRKFHEKTQK